jgi:hypothetical protein
MEKSNIKNHIYKTVDLPISGSAIQVSSSDKTEVNRIVNNFFSYILDKHS